MKPIDCSPFDNPELGRLADRLLASDELAAMPVKPPGKFALAVLLAEFCTPSNAKRAMLRAKAAADAAQIMRDMSAFMV
jgi:hypothetical protein